MDNIKDFLSYNVPTIIAAFAIAATTGVSGATVYAATTIGDNISTSGTLEVTGNSTFSNAFFANKVGIGTTTPNANLEVVGDVRVASDSYITQILARPLDHEPGFVISSYSSVDKQLREPYLQITGQSLNQSGSNDIRIYSRAEGNAKSAVTFETESGGSLTERMRINNLGNVGIGTTNPASLLDLSTTGSGIMSRREVTWTDSNTGALLGLALKTSGDMTDDFGPGMNFYIEDDAQVENSIASLVAVRDGADNSGKFILETRKTGANTGKLTMNSDGNIGIGTLTPQEKLDINGANYIRFNPESDGDGIYSNNSEFSMKASAGNGKFIFYTGGRATENRRMIIDENGNVGIGTTSPGSKLEIENGYLKLDTYHSTAAPDPGDCDDLTEVGRMIVGYSNDTPADNEAGLWYCGKTNASGYSWFKL